MNLEGDNRLNLQLRLDFSSAPTGEARQAGREDIESPSAVSEPERPAWHSNRAGSLHPASGDAGSAEASGIRRSPFKPWRKRSSTSRKVTDG